MNKFINYTNNVVTLDTYRLANAQVTDFDDIVNALSSGSDENLTCSVDGSELALLEDGHYWNGSNATVEALEELHWLLSQND